MAFEVLKQILPEVVHVCMQLATDATKLTDILYIKDVVFVLFFRKDLDKDVEIYFPVEIVMLLTLN